MSGDPVSWLLIEAGWKVVGADDADLGKVAEVAGDTQLDIFDGLAVAPGLIAKPRYVPSELVAEITEGAVRLTLDREAFDRLDEYLEPATSAQIEADNKSESAVVADARELEGELFAPIERHERPVSLARRLWLGLRGLFR